MSGVKLYISGFCILKSLCFVFNVQQDLTNIELFLVSREVESALLAKDTSKCLNWCYDNKSKLRKMKVIYLCFSQYTGMQCLACHMHAMPCTHSMPCMPHACNALHAFNALHATCMQCLACHMHEMLLMPHTCNALHATCMKCFSCHIPAMPCMPHA